MKDYESLDAKANEVADKEIVDDVFVVKMLQRLLKAPIMQDAEEEDSTFHVEVILREKEVCRLLEMGRKALKKETSLLSIDQTSLPLTVVADLHGYCMHLRALFEQLGGPAEHRYLFLGDYVDRGMQGVETMCLLIASKLRYPSRIFLLRGNHEDVQANLGYGFKSECEKKFGENGMKVWTAFLEMFGQLPLAALINGRILAMHGGISPFIHSVHDINKIKERPTCIPPSGVITDLVWADPDRRNAGWSLSHRGISFTFDKGILNNFCDANSVELVIRGHQITNHMLSNGFHYFSGRLVTLFSAPHYMKKNNAGCVIHIGKDMRVRMCAFRTDEVSDSPSNSRRSSRRERPSESSETAAGEREDPLADTAIDERSSEDGASRTPPKAEE